MAVVLQQIVHRGSRLHVARVRDLANVTAVNAHKNAWESRELHVVFVFLRMGQSRQHDLQFFALFLQICGKLAVVGPFHAIIPPAVKGEKRTLPNEYPLHHFMLFYTTLGE